MKKIAITLSVITILALAACSGNDNKQVEENNEVEDPVMNSGPETEAEIAKDAVKDSAQAGSDSTIRHDADAPSTPH
jgi:hypothetical protein